MSIELLAVTQNLLAWYNVVFAACFVVGLFFTALQVLGLAHSDVDLDADADADVDAGVDTDADVDADADADIDAHADVDTDADADADTDSEASVHVGAGGGVGPGQAVAQFVGVGRVPVSAILMTLFYTVGLTGWIANTLLRPRYESDRALFVTSLAIALVVGLVVMRLVSGLLGKYLPSVLTSALTRRQMVGLVGEAALPINERFGRVAVKDQYGTLHQLNCKVPSGVEPVAKGTRVILTKYLPEGDMYYVGRAR